MIASFASKETEQLFYDKRPKKFPVDILIVARRKLLMIHAAQTVEDLKVPPGNRLEMLKGKLKGCNSVRINDQWRICFRFKNGIATEVQIIDYH